MTLQDVMRRYFGWCPRFETIHTRSTPLTNLSISGKIVLSTLLATTGLLSVILSIVRLVENGSYYLTTLGGNVSIISACLELVSGLFIVLLLIDLIKVRQFQRRHRLETVSISLIWAIQNVLSLAYLFLEAGNQGFNLTQNVYLILRYVVASALFFYAAYKLMADPIILDKRLLLLLSLYFIMLTFYNVFFYFFNPDWLQSANEFTKFGAATELIAYAVATYFFVRTYLGSRIGSRFDLELPRYVRGDLFFYGLTQTILGVYYTFMYKPNVLRLEGLVGASYSLSYGLALTQSIMFLLVSFYPITFNVGKTRSSTLIGG